MSHAMGFRVFRQWALMLAGAFFLEAQATDIWRNGNWTLQAPSAGKCDSLPLLAVKGPGSIFDVANASVLANLQNSLPTALSSICPGVREVVISSGRERRLIKVNEAPRSTASETAVTQGAQTSNPVQRTEPSTGTASRIVANSAVPPLGTRSNLPSLSSVRGNEDKCEVLYKWLESGKADNPSAQNYAYRMPTEMLRIFRDEPMMAVFSMSYDRTENRWRLEQYEKTISRCLGVAPLTPPRNIPFAGVRSNSRTMQQYWQQFAQYRRLLDQSFLGQPGPFEPAAISHYVQQVREQTVWGNQALASAAAAQPDLASFERLTEYRRSLAQQLAALTSPERAQVENYLERRQAEIAPEIAKNWLRTADSADKTVAAARLLHKRKASLAPVLNMLDTQAKASWNGSYYRVVEPLIAESLQSNIAKVGGVPATLPGVVQLMALRSEFELTFGDLADIPAVQAVRDEYGRARTRILTSTLPTWRQEVDRLPLEAPAVASKHQEFEKLFPSRPDSTALFSAYEAPLRSKEDQLRALIAANLRKDQERLESSNRSASSRSGSQPKPNSAGQVMITSFTTQGLRTESTLTKLFSGDFLGIDFDRNDVKFNGLFDQYLVAYSRHCSQALPDDRVEMTKQECSSSRITEVRNGWGTLISSSETCNEWRTVHVGWAKPALYSAKNTVTQQRVADIGREISQMVGDMAKSNPLNNFMSKLNAAVEVAGDMDALVQMNACKSAGLERFEDNLRLFALNKQPIRLDGKSLGSAVTVIPGIPFKDQDYTKLIADLVEDDARKWGAMARYVRGSVNGSSVAERDDVGRPVKVVAPYSWEGLLGRKRASVTLTFTDGLPDCFYYSETPAVCHASNRKIVAAYAEGGYQ